MSNNYYDILGVSSSATSEEIKKAYRRLILIHHPDKGGSASKCREILEAYEVLFDQVSRKEYDKKIVIHLLTYQ